MSISESISLSKETRLDSLNGYKDEGKKGVFLLVRLRSVEIQLVLEKVQNVYHKSTQGK